METMQEKPFCVYFSDGRDTLRLTEYKALKLLDSWRDAKVKLIDIHDDNGKYMETIDKRIIKGIKRVFGVTKTRKQYACDYGTRHDYDDTCTCRDAYKNMSGIKFWHVLKEIFPHLQYPSDITEEMQGIVIDWVKDNNYDNTIPLTFEQKKELETKLDILKF